MREFYSSSLVSTTSGIFGLALLASMLWSIHSHAQTSYDEYGDEFNHEANIHYANTVRGSITHNDDVILMKALRVYRHAIIADMRDPEDILHLLNRIEVILASRSEALACPLDNHSKKCQEYFSAMQPFVER